MCQFNFAIVDSNSDDLKLKEIFLQNGFAFAFIDNPHLNQHLDSNLKVIYTTKSHCDCNSAIGSNKIDDFINPELDYLSNPNFKNEIKKFKRKKWSDNKIRRYYENIQKNTLKKQANESDKFNDELKKWSNVITETLASSTTKRFGILTHFYSGNLDDEKFESVSILKSEIDTFEIESLRKLDYDTLFLLS